MNEIGESTTKIYQSERSTDLKTGRTNLVIKVDGKTCISFPIEGQVPKRYAGFSLILEDLEDALLWLRNVSGVLIVV